MADASAYKMLSNISFILAGCMLVISILLFFRYRIPMVIGILSGRTSKKKIREIREASTKNHEGDLQNPEFDRTPSENRNLKSHNAQKKTGGGMKKTSDETALLSYDSMRVTEELKPFRTISNIIIVHTDERIGGK